MQGSDGQANRNLTRCAPGDTPQRDSLDTVTFYPEIALLRTDPAILARYLYRMLPVTTLTLAEGFSHAAPGSACAIPGAETGTTNLLDLDPCFIRGLNIPESRTILPQSIPAS